MIDAASGVALSSTPEAVLSEFSGVDVAACVADDWRGDASVPVEVASEIVGAALARIEWNSAKNFSYQEYRRERKAAAQAERDAQAEKIREERRKEYERIEAQNRQKSEADRHRAFTQLSARQREEDEQLYGNAGRSR